MMAPWLARAVLGGALIAVGSLATGASAHAEDLALQGYSGLLAVPNADVLPSGSFQALFTNDNYPRWVGSTQTYVLALGMLPFFEIAGRVTHSDRGDGTIVYPQTPAVEDLSANVKLQLPFHLLHPVLPRVAVGAQDLGSAAPNYRSRYLVLTKRLSMAELTIGYGTGPDRLKGVFGGVEISPFRWFSVLADHDTTEASVGGRVALSARPAGFPLRLVLTGRVPVERAKNSSFGVTFEGPLGVAHGDPARPAPPPSGWAFEPRFATDLSRVAADPAEGPAPLPTARDATTLRQALVGFGFENVRVVDRGEVVYVEYEDDVFRHSALDGLGVVLGLASQPVGFKQVEVVLKRNHLRLLAVRAPSDSLRAYFAGSALAGLPDDGLADRLELTDRLGEMPPQADGRLANPSALRPRIVLSPAVRTVVASDLGTFDYLLSLRPALIAPLWSGAALYGELDVPVTWSGVFDDDGVFRNERRGVHGEHALLYQAANLPGGMRAQLGGGLFRSDKYGGLAELSWRSPEGLHQLGAVGGAFVSRREQVFRSAVASYRVLVPGLDLRVSAEGGEYLYGDRGVAFSLSKFFGDTEIALNYSWTAVQLASLSISLPLTPRRAMRPGPLQVRGATRWTYGQGTVVNSSANPIVNGLAALPTTNYSLDEEYLDQGRLTPGFVRRHLGRLREAYLEFVGGAAVRRGL